MEQCLLSSQDESPLKAKHFPRIQRKDLKIAAITVTRFLVFFLLLFLFKNGLLKLLKSCDCWVSMASEGRTVLTNSSRFIDFDNSRSI